MAISAQTMKKITVPVSLKTLTNPWIFFMFQMGAGFQMAMALNRDSVHDENDGESGHRRILFIVTRRGLNLRAFESAPNTGGLTNTIG